MKMKIKTFMMLGLMTFIASMTFVSCSDSDDSVAAQSSNNQISVIADVQNTMTRATPITSVQIPFDMRSVIPAICGHSFFKYFYGCKVNVLNRYLGRQTVFFC